MRTIDGMTQFTGIEYLKLAIANSFGMDKSDWLTRLIWVEENIDNLITLAPDAAEPYQYIKAIRALEDACAHIPTGYCVGFDATASGAQIYACLSGCLVTGAKVNLVNDAIRHEVYSDMAKAMGANIPREDMKEACMTFFYGSRAVPERVFGVDTPMLAAFYNLLSVEMKGAYEVMNLLLDCQNHVGEEYAITAPDGHVAYIRTQVKHMDTVSTSISMAGEEEWVMDYEHMEFGFKYKDKSIPANVAHLLDSWLVRTVILECKKLGFEAYHVHDCYFCSPKYMNQLRLVYREALAQLAEMNYLDTIVGQLLGSNVSFGINGSKLAKEIRKSDYALC